jgi:hypothetical protein
MKYLLILAMLLAAAVLFVSLPEVAHGTKPCVTNQEFNTVPFTTKAKVEEFFDAGPGQRTDLVTPGSDKQMAREYPRCKPGWVVVIYRKSNRQAQSFWMFTPDERRA